MSLESLRLRASARRGELRALRIAILAGGGSAERDVSVRSGQAMYTALSESGHNVQLLVIAPDGISLERVLSGSGTGLALSPDASAANSTAVQTSLLPALKATSVALSALHGSHGENGAWQGLLELLGLPYASAGVLGSALAMDKISAKRIVSALGILTPRYWVLRQGKPVNSLGIPPEVKSVVVKPPQEGSSVGIEILPNDTELDSRIEPLARSFDPLLIEECVEGREITASIIGHCQDPLCLPLIEIRPKSGFYDYQAKYTAGMTEYLCPAPVGASVNQQLQADSSRIYTEMYLEPYSRLDWILDQDNRAWFLEANTLPGFTGLSLLPQAARAAGIEMTELLELLILLALERSERIKPRGGASV